MKRYHRIRASLKTVERFARGRAARMLSPAHVSAPHPHDAGASSSTDACQFFMAIAPPAVERIGAPP